LSAAAIGRVRIRQMSFDDDQPVVHDDPSHPLAPFGLMDPL